MENMGDSQPLYRLWPGLPPREKKALVEGVGSILGTFHREGFVHRDFKWSNILVSAPAGEPRIVVVDFDGCRTVRQVTAAFARKDIDRFVADLHKYDPDGELESIFLASVGSV
jgi:tRNA A-37 threonylcarbamoyl transferase component Bud32